MKTEENFYDIINSKFSDRQIPFDEENWQSMRKMIDDSRTDKRRTMWLLVFACLLLLGGSTFGIYEWNNNADGQQYHMVAGNNSANSSSSIINNTNKQTINQGIAIQSGTSESTDQSNDATIASNNNTSAQSQAQPVGTMNDIAKENAHSTNKNKYTNKLADKKNTIDKNNGRSVAGNINSLNNNMKGINEQSDLSSSGKGIEVPATESKPQMPSNSIAVKSTGSVTKVSSHRADSMAAGDALPQRFSDEPRIFQGMTNIFSVEVGGEYCGGWEIGSVDQGKGFNANAGIGYAHYLGSKIFLKTGLLFSTFGNMSPLTYNYQHSVGNLIYDSVITTKRLYFLKIPVQLEYFVGRNKRSSVGLGGEVWFLVGNRGSATTYQQLDNNPPTNMMTYSQNIPLDGYSKINVSSHILYRYVFSRKLSMYAMLYVGLTNMKNNAFFGEKIVERANGIQYTLSYNLK